MHGTSDRSDCPMKCDQMTDRFDHTHTHTDWRGYQTGRQIANWLLLDAGELCSADERGWVQNIFTVSSQLQMRIFGVFLRLGHWAATGIRAIFSRVVGDFSVNTSGNRAQWCGCIAVGGDGS